MGGGCATRRVPELSLTGYALDAPAVTVDDPALASVVEACAVMGAVALVGAPVGGEPIATLRVGAAGVEVADRKRWLGGAEGARFAPGDEAAVAIDVDGWRVGLGVCKDTGVAEHVRAVAALEVDLYVAGLVHRPDELAVHDVRGVAIARACDAPVAFASFAGPTGAGYDRTAGTSTVWSAGGDVLARASPKPGELACATLR